MKRVYGRLNGAWVVVTTDANGYDDNVNLTWLWQCLKLSQGESPFWADWGIPAQRSIMQQIFPDYYVNLMQQRFAQYFAALQILKVPSTTPTYSITAITQQGAKLSLNSEAQ